MIKNIGVHQTHCCILHGCKYGEDSICPVVQGQIKQEYNCEECKDYYLVGIQSEVSLSPSEFESIASGCVNHFFYKDQSLVVGQIVKITTPCESKQIVKVISDVNRTSGVASLDTYEYWDNRW